MALPTANLNIDFGETSDCSYELTTEVISSPSPPNTKVYIRVYGASIDKLQNILVFKEAQGLGLGSIKITQEDVLENIVFDNSVYSKTKFPISSINNAIAATSLISVRNKSLITLESSGSFLNMQKSGDICVKIVNITENIYGSVDLNYKANKIYKEFVWTTPNVTAGTSFPFFVLDDGEVIDTFNISVEIGSSYEAIDVKFIVSDIANDRIVKDATVRIIQSGNSDFTPLEDTTNENGEVIFSLFPGQTYQIKTTADGFIDSDLDYISNDSFTVPVVTE